MYAKARSICWFKAPTTTDESDRNGVSTPFDCIHDCQKEIEIVLLIGLRGLSTISVTQALTQSHSPLGHKYAALPTIFLFQETHPRQRVLSTVPTQPTSNCLKAPYVMANVPLLRLLFAVLTLSCSLSLCMPTGISQR